MIIFLLTQFERDASEGHQHFTLELRLNNIRAAKILMLEKVNFTLLVPYIFNYIYVMQTNVHSICYLTQFY
jgi:hypothetical protein